MKDDKELVKISTPEIEDLILKYTQLVKDFTPKQHKQLLKKQKKSL